MKAVALSLMLLFTGSAFAAPPPGADPNSDLAKWYRSLQQPVQGMSCCSMADCRNVRYRIEANHYDVFIDHQTFGMTAPDTWVPVPNANVIRKFNPTGAAVACWYMKQVLCFVAAPEG